MPNRDARFESLYREHRVLVFNYLCFRLGDKDGAEDAAVETFERALKALRKYDVAESPKAWILTIAKNVSNRALRKRMSNEHLPLDGLAEAASTEDSGREAAIKDLAARALALMNPNEREAVWLHDAMGVTHAEIADTMGVPIGTVLSWIWRARKKVMRELGEVAV